MEVSSISGARRISSSREVPISLASVTPWLPGTSTTTASQTYSLAHRRADGVLVFSGSTGGLLAGQVLGVATPGDAGGSLGRSLATGDLDADGPGQDNSQIIPSWSTSRCSSGVPKARLLSPTLPGPS